MIGDDVHQIPKNKMFVTAGVILLCLVHQKGLKLCKKVCKLKLVVFVRDVHQWLNFHCDCHRNEYLLDKKLS